MKSLIISAVTALTLAACAGGNGGSDLGGILGGGSSTSANNGSGGAATAIGKSLIQNYAHNQCSVELNKRQEWRLMALAFKAIRTIHPDYPLWRDFAYEYEFDRLAIDLINGSPLLREWVDDVTTTPGDLEAVTRVDEVRWLKETEAFKLYR